MLGDGGVPPGRWPTLVGRVEGAVLAAARACRWGGVWGYTLPGAAAETRPSGLPGVRLPHPEDPGLVLRSDDRTNASPRRAADGVTLGST